MVVKDTEDGKKPALPEAVLKAAKAAGATSTGVTYQAPETSPANLSEPAAAVYEPYSEVRNTASPTAANNNEKLSPTDKARKEAALSELDELIKGAGAAGEEVLLQKLLALRAALSTANSKESLTVVLSSFNVVMAQYGSAKADDKVIDIRSMHKDLYATDAVYRAATDENRRQRDKVVSELDKKLEAADKHAERHSYKTEFDDKEKQLRETYEKLKNSGDDIDALTALNAWLEVRKKQNEERIKQAIANNDVEGVELLKGDTKTAVDNTQKETNELFQKQLKSFLDAFRKNLKNPSITEEQLNKLVAEEKASREKNFLNQKSDEEKYKFLERLSNTTLEQAESKNREVTHKVTTTFAFAEVQAVDENKQQNLPANKAASKSDDMQIG